MRIVYHSFGGRFSDSPRAIFEALRERGGGHEHLWLCEDEHAAGFPAGVATVPAAEAAAALQSCDVLIANAHTEVEWEKPDGCLYLQTWHGTPLKQIHWDVLWAPEGRLERLQRDVDRWDALISPNAYSTRVFSGAFRHRAEVWETGYPRNDVLLGPDAAAVRRRVRAELDIPDGTTAVLYTPTWRDDFVFGEGGRQLELELDVERFASELGGDHVLLLRTHYMLTGRLAAAEHPAVRDVSFHPQVSDLYLAADVLVTDYSSTMFDFAVTGKPIVFYVYDLDDYRDRQRGFYFDFVPEAPGPVVETTEELIAALRDPRTGSEHYAAFRERFCSLEDGRATERVLDRLSAALSPDRPQTPARGPGRP